MRVCEDSGWVKGVRLQFVRDAKATQIVSIVLFKTIKNSGLITLGVLHLALQTTPNVITPNVIN